MYVLLVCLDGARDGYEVHLIAENGTLAHSAPEIGDLLKWLWDKGEEQVVAMTNVGAELFLIEECTGLTMVLPSLSLRRAFHGTCAQLPELLGLGPDPTLRARILQDRKELASERRDRRARWVRRATGASAIGAANENDVAGRA